MVAGPGETVGAELQENDGVDGILFTGSFEVGFDLYKHFAKRFPKPVIVEMGGKNPAIVTQDRGPRRGGRGRHARRLRLQRPEVLGQQPRLRGAAGLRGVHRTCSPRRPRSIADRRPTRAPELDGPGHQPARPGALRERRRPRRGRTAASSQAASD